MWFLCARLNAGQRPLRLACTRPKHRVGEHEALYDACRGRRHVRVQGHKRVRGVCVRAHSLFGMAGVCRSCQKANARDTRD